ncbi:TetR/AcrR family transcriptional regulator [Streptomyces globisporus]|uniref:TetR/AcrR family transcriptional regulator n=1 Tax=Streptomyces globisporus TaxID=1908 RepID=UPI00386874E0|nr:TetR/AcrR family transcriptional regulator [Streptomyces globisporus]
MESALEAIAEGGVAAVSVADVGRRVGVSAAAPYRHFANRQALLVAVAIEVARSLADRLAAVRDERPAASPVDLLAGFAACYTRFHLERGAGLDLIYRAELRELEDVELAREGRRVMDVVLSVAWDIAGTAEGGIALLEQVFAVAHGYAQMFLIALLSRRLLEPGDAAESAGNTVRLIAEATASRAAAGR